MGMNWLQLSELKARFDRAVKSHQETIEVYEEISHLSRGQDPVVHESCRRIIAIEKQMQAIMIKNSRDTYAAFEKFISDLNKIGGEQ